MSNNPYDFSVGPNSLEELWMPFTPNRQFKKNPRMVVSADGMYYKDSDGKEILDCTAGLWAVNAGHNRQRIKDAITAQMSLLDYAPCFNMGHPAAFRAAGCRDLKVSAITVAFSRSAQAATAST